MTSFDSLYNRLVSASVSHRLDSELGRVRSAPDFDEYHLECLLNPGGQAAVFRLSDCTCPDEEKQSCKDGCVFDALSVGKDGNVRVDGDRCAGCSRCIDRCRASNLADRRDMLPLLELLQTGGAPVYAMIAPAFIGQFSEDVSPGKLRSAFKALGFAGMLEVALFADILTLKEALEFDRSIQNDRDFLLTSCCCPIWIAMIRKIYRQLAPHLPPSVSPMVACGRTVKRLYPDAKTVFIGPCVAKKAEARERDVADAVDFVLSFQEIWDVFGMAGINPALLPEDLRDHSSAAGRLYARVGGVSTAVQQTVDRLKPKRSIPLRAAQANGVPECKKLLNDIRNGRIDTNFLEGMGCVGGCVGGPKAFKDRSEGTLHVDRYAKEALYQTPADNPYVIELLKSLGFETIESLLENGHMFTRDFSPAAPESGATPAK